MIDKRPIIGGHENGGILYIGRLSYEGNIRIGKIVPFNTEDARFYFNNQGSEKSVSSYEVLVYNENAVDVRLGQ